MRLVLETSSGVEHHDPYDLIDPRDVSRRRLTRCPRMCARTDAEAMAWGEEVTEAFNRSRRPGDEARVFLRAFLEPTPEVDRLRAEIEALTTGAEKKRVRARDLVAKAARLEARVDVMEKKAAKLLERLEALEVST